MPDKVVCPCCGSDVNASDLTSKRELSEVQTRLNLEPTPARMFLALWRANGQVVTHKELADLMAIKGRKPPTTGSIRTARRGIMVALEKHPVEIRNCWGVGYRLVKSYPDWHWRFAQN